MECSIRKLVNYVKLYNIDSFLPQINGFIKALSCNGKKPFEVELLYKLIPNLQPEVLSTLLGLLSDMKMVEVRCSAIVVINIKELDSLVEHLNFVFDNGLLTGQKVEERLLWTPPMGVQIDDDQMRFERIDTFIHKIIQKTRNELIFFAPFYSEGGATMLCDSLSPLLKNQPQVKVTMISASLSDNGDRNRKAFQRMESLIGPLVFNAIKVYATEGEELPLHAKFVISDRQKGILSSANFSINGLVRQIEIGARMTEKQCQDISWLVKKLIDVKIVERVTRF